MTPKMNAYASPIRSLRNEGLSWADIGRELGISRQYAAYIGCRIGLPKGKPAEQIHKMTSKGSNRLPRLCECNAHGFVPLNDWNTALFDPQNLTAIEGRAWSAYKKRGVRTIYVRDNYHPREYMHRTILPDSKEVDHLNHDGCDNRRFNIRPATRSQNNANCRTFHNNRLGLKGVHEKRPGKFCVQISVNNHRRIVGTFDCPFQAALAYDAAAIEYHGEFALTNTSLGLLQILDEVNR